MNVTYKPYQDKYLTTYYNDGRLAVFESALSLIGFFVATIVPAFAVTVPGRLSRLWRALSTEQAATLVVLSVLLLIVAANKLFA